MNRFKIRKLTLALITVGLVLLMGVYLPMEMDTFQEVKKIHRPSLSEIVESLPELELPKKERLKEKSKPKNEIATRNFRPFISEEEELKYHPLKDYQPFPETSPYHLGEKFQIPFSIQYRVDFWRNVFARYDKNKTILHDSDHLDIVYGVLDFSDLYENPYLDPNTFLKTRRFIEQKAIEEIQAMLLRFEEGDLPSFSRELELYNRYKMVSENKKFAKASTRIRSQSGMKDRFEEGLIRFGRYRERLEEIFEGEGVPQEITRLTFVESMFTLNAVSKVGATGPWQFMLETARDFIQVNDVVDERRDPLICGRAAAQLLKKYHGILKTWPMAINAYNTGPLRMLKARNQLKTTDIDTIIENFESPGYQFASRNFYPEFLAALEVANNHKDYFGELEFDEPVPFDEILLPHHTSFYRLAQTMAIDIDVLKDLNPSYLEENYNEYVYVPKNYSIRVPLGETNVTLAALYLVHKLDGGNHWHIVGGKESLDKIATRYETSPHDIREANGLVGNQLKPGQILKIPGSQEKIVKAYAD